MKRSVLALCLLALSCFSAQARLGESEAQLITRFGSATVQSPLLPGTVHLSFDKQGFTIDVSLINGVSVQEIYHDQAGDIHPDKADYLLQTNQQGQQWVEQPVGSKGGRWWKREDGARAYLRGPMFQLKSNAYRELESASTDARPSVDGF